MAQENFFTGGDAVAVDLVNVKQVDSKPAASGFSDGNVIYDRTEGKFYKVTSGAWGVVPGSAVGDVSWTSGLSGVPTALVNGPGAASGVAGLDASSLLVQAAKLMNQGSAAAPGLAFDGDPDTGLYRPTQNEMAVATGGSTSARFHGEDVTVSRLVLAPAQGGLVMSRPDGFGWRPPFTIFPVVGGYATDLNTEAYKIRGERYWVDPTGTGDGRSAGSPAPDLRTAIDNINTDGVPTAEIIVEPGYYPLGWTNRRSNAHLSVRCFSGEAIFAVDPEPSWTLESGSTYSYTKGTGAEVGSNRVYDFSNSDTYGDAQRLTEVGSVTDVNTTPNSAYYDTGSRTLYVHTFDDRAPDDNIYAALDLEAGGNSAGQDLYVENIAFYGGTHAWVSATEPGQTQVFKGCRFLFGDGNDNFETFGNGLTILDDCYAAQADKDGLNYTDGFVFEYDCTVRSSGGPNSATVDSNNASTAHGACRVIRLNCDYRDAQNRTVHDVNNAKAWMIACFVGDSRAEGGTPFAVGAGFTTIANETARIWMDDCTIDGPGYADNDDGCNLFVRRTVVPSMVLGVQEEF